jgi:hypothetical protein
VGRSLRPDGCPKKLIMVAQSGYAKLSILFSLSSRTEPLEFVPYRIVQSPERKE